MGDKTTAPADVNARDEGTPKLSAGTPIPATNADPDRSLTLSSAVRIPLLVGLFIALLTATCLGIPAVLYHLQEVWNTEFSDEFVDTAIRGAIPLVFVLVITYATGRHRLRNWVATRRLGTVRVDLSGYKADGENIEVSINGRQLKRARRIEVIREVIDLDHLSPDQRAHILNRPDHSTARASKSRAGPVLRAGNDHIAWRNERKAEFDDDDPRFSPAAVATFPITKSLAENDTLFQRLRINIEMPWWFSWRSDIMIWQSQPNPDQQSASTPETPPEEPPAEESPVVW